MRQGQSLEVQLVDKSGQPLRMGNVVVELEFFVKGQFRFGFKVGRTNQTGSLSVSYDQIEELRRSRAEENLMDYNTKLDECDPTIRIEVPTDERLIEQRDSALRFYQRAPRWAENWPSNALVESDATLVELRNDRTRIDVLSEIV